MSLQEIYQNLTNALQIMEAKLQERPHQQRQGDPTPVDIAKEARDIFKELNIEMNEDLLGWKKIDLEPLHSEFKNRQGYASTNEEGLTNSEVDQILKLIYQDYHQFFNRHKFKVDFTTSRPEMFDKAGGRHQFIAEKMIIDEKQPRPTATKATTGSNHHYVVVNVIAPVIPLEGGSKSVRRILVVISVHKSVAPIITSYGNLNESLQYNALVNQEISKIIDKIKD